MEFFSFFVNKNRVFSITRCDRFTPYYKKILKESEKPTFEV